MLVRNLTPEVKLVRPQRSEPRRRLMINTNVSTQGGECRNLKTPSNQIRKVKESQVKMMIYHKKTKGAA